MVRLVGEGEDHLIEKGEDLESVELQPGLMVAWELPWVGAVGHPADFVVEVESPLVVLVLELPCQLVPLDQGSSWGKET